MVAPKPFKYICPQCGYSKIIKPKSDALNPMDFISTCSECNTKMKRKELSGISKLFAELFK